MKKTFVIVGLLVVASLVFANGAQEARTIEGKVTIVDSIPTITDGKDSWALPPGPFYQVAWENGIKEGDTLKVEGFVMERERGDEKMKMIRPSRVWANGKELNVSNVARMGKGPRGDECRDPRGRQDRCDRFDRRSDRKDRKESRRSGANKG